MRKRIEQVEKEVLKKVAEVRKKRKAEAKKIAQTKVNYVFKVNDKVRLEDGNAVGIIERSKRKKHSSTTVYLPLKQMSVS